jgi:hypothetical protein
VKAPCRQQTPTHGQQPAIHEDQRSMNITPDDLTRMVTSQGQAGLLGLISLIARGCVQLSQACLNEHSVGLADFDGTGTQKEISAGRQQLSVLMEYVNDPELKNNLVLLLSRLQYLSDIDRRIVSVYSEAYATDDRKKLKKEIRKSRINGNAFPSRVTSLAHETEEIASTIKEIQTAIEKRIQQLSEK